MRAHADGALEGRRADHQRRRGADHGQRGPGRSAGRCESTMHWICTSSMKSSGNSGRMGRSIIRIVRISLVLGRPSRLKKPPGHLARGVLILAVVHVQREEVHVSRRDGAEDRRQHHRVAVPHHDGAVGLLGHLAGFQSQRPACDLSFHSDNSHLCSYLTGCTGSLFPRGRRRVDPQAAARRRATRRAAHTAETTDSASPGGPRRTAGRTADTHFSKLARGREARLRTSPNPTWSPTTGGLHGPGESQ